MQVTVMLPTMGRTALLRRTLESLIECDRPDGLDQVIVIENGGQCGAATVVEDLRAKLPLKYLFVEEPNKSIALNHALRLVKSGLIVFIDDDIRLSPSLLMDYVKAAQENPSSFFGGPFGVDYERRPPEWLMRYLPRSARGWSLCDDSRRQGSHLWFLGFNWAAFANHIRDVGDFNERRGPSMPMTGQETDMQQRLAQAGYSPHYVANAWVWHFVPENRCNATWVVERAERRARAGEYSTATQASHSKLAFRTVWWRCHPRHWLASFVAAAFPADRTRFSAEQWSARRRSALAALREIREAGVGEPSTHK